MSLQKLDLNSSKNLNENQKEQQYLTKSEYENSSIKLININKKQNPSIDKNIIENSLENDSTELQKSTQSQYDLFSKNNNKYTQINNDINIKNSNFDNDLQNKTLDISNQTQIFQLKNLKQNLFQNKIEHQKNDIQQIKQANLSFQKPEIEQFLSNNKCQQVLQIDQFSQIPSKQVNNLNMNCNDSQKQQNQTQQLNTQTQTQPKSTSQSKTLKQKQQQSYYDNQYEWLEKYKNNKLIQQLLQQDDVKISSNQNFKQKNFDISKLFELEENEQLENNFNMPSQKEYQSRMERYNTMSNQSRFHNLNKGLIIKILRFFNQSNLNKIQMPKPLRRKIFQVITKVKQGGKHVSGAKITKSDLFNHSHYNTLFLQLNPTTLSKIQQKDREIHLNKLVFNIDISTYDEFRIQQKSKEEKICDIKTIQQNPPNKSLKSYYLQIKKQNSLNSQEQDLQQNIQNQQNSENNIIIINTQSQNTLNPEKMFIQTQNQKNKQNNTQYDQITLELLESINFVKQCIFRLITKYLKQQILGDQKFQMLREYEYRVFFGIQQMINGNCLTRF
ncbi:hypothetical protein PPERSA_09294 [Pseudocohnilembus persalinus]|uniref:Uncharacterized protein n=1 Tax=Pseudocohnilembus persalinus TaxID=266149 RepID=A0A0V0R629_PSEPJ|nr:hypothetical protein PPERSA_09294 [Pseudocohnilembus persalinus]|eukprot:KRX09624.1 hypothetical protein PPERSA_09294 [Pseudocohnilembus persalinus]